MNSIPEEDQKIYVYPKYLGNTGLIFLLAVSEARIRRYFNLATEKNAERPTIASLPKTYVPFYFFDFWAFTTEKATVLRGIVQLRLWLFRGVPCAGLGIC
jgi:hypothetical protein